MVELRFESRLRATRERVWSFITSAKGINTELRPLMKMTAPKGALDLNQVVVGERIARSWLLLFGFIPIDRSDVTLVELVTGHRFVERSPMKSMRMWQHERQLEEMADGDVTLIDQLTFEPRFFAGLVTWFVSQLFRHRHAVLRRTFY